MDEIIPILFALLIFLGPLLLKFLGNMFEGADSPSSAPGRLTPEQRRALQERARQLRQQQEPPAVDAEVIHEGHSTFANQQSLDQYGADATSELIELRDDRMDAHLQATFDHTLGTLGRDAMADVQENVLGTEAAEGQPKENLAAGIAAMMKDPAGIRKAFIIGEILQRPSG